MNDKKDSIFTPYKAPHDQGFTAIPNKIITQKKLSVSARLVLMYLLSNRADYKVYQRGICTTLGMGICSVKSAIALLEKSGYLKRWQIREKGKFSYFKYEYHSEPVFLNCSQVPVHSVDNHSKKTSPRDGKPLAVNHTLTKTSLKSPSETDNVPTLKPINRTEGTKNKTLPQRFKLTEPQTESFALLKRSAINTDENTLCYFAKTYSFAQIAGALQETKEAKPANSGAYLRKLLELTKTKDPKTFNKASNSAFAYDFKDSAGWEALKITKTHAETENMKISLLMDSEAFTKALIAAYDLKKD